MGMMRNFIDLAARTLIAACEVASNKATSFATVNNTLYPSVQAVKNYADNLVVGLLDDRGNYNASGNVFPSAGGSGTAGAVMKGDVWYISVAGVLGSGAVYVGDTVRALVDAPGQTAANWCVMQFGLPYVPAPQDSPTFTGTPAAPTAAPGTNTTQLATTAFVQASAGFPSGTRLLFNQTSAPTGWTKDTTAALNDTILRIVTGTVGSGGSTAFSTFNAQTATASYTLASADIPAHTHAVTDGGHTHGVTDGGHAHVMQKYTTGSASADNPNTGASNKNATVGAWSPSISVASSTTGISINSGTTGITLANTGGGGGHAHGITTNIKYNDVIIASKN